MENLQTSTPSMQFLLLEQVQFLNVNVNDNDDSLLQWELVDVIDTEEEEPQQEIEIEEEIRTDDPDSSSVIWSVSSHISDPIEAIRHRLLHLDADVKNHNHRDRDDVDADGDNHDDEDEDEYDLDDELVPWDIGNKFGRQRMRKLGKRAFSKMNNSKRNPNLFVRPGCVRGKHGLGLKHSC